MQSLLNGLSAYGIVVIAMTIVLAMGGIDLSVGSVMGLSSMVTALIIRGGGPVAAAVAAGFAVGLVCGLVNGFFIGTVKLNAFITTLAMMGIARGLTLMSTGGSAVSIAGVSDTLRFIGQSTLAGIPIIIVVFVVVAVLGDFFLRHTQPFRKVFLIGSNEKAAQLSGINVTKTKILVYTLSALLSSFAGFLSLCRFSASTPTTGAGVEMIAISAAVIGGASLQGGSGTVFGAFLGILLLNIVNNGLVLLNVSVYGQNLISGMILLIAVLVDKFSNSKKQAYL
jgi:ribose transport system permease protein